MTPWFWAWAVVRAENLEGDECVRFWRSRVGRSFGDCFRVFRRFCREVLAKDEVFGGMSPSQLVEWQVNARGREAFRLKGLAQAWIEDLPLRFSTKRTYLSQIGSFFLHNHVPWPPDLGFHFTSDTPPVDGKLDFETFRRILLSSNKKYRCAFLMMSQGLMGEGELVYVNLTHWRLVLDKLAKNVGVFRISLPGRKKNRNVKGFYTLLDTRSDWGETMRDYLKSLPSVPRGALFRNNERRPLSTANIRRYFHDRAIEAGVIKQFSPNCRSCGGETVRFRGYKPREGTIGYKCRECGYVAWARDFNKKFSGVRYGVNPHEIRDLMRSRWQVSTADPVVCEFIMGHEVDPNAYNKFMKYEAWYPIQEYRKASKWLNVISEDPHKIDRKEVETKLQSSEAKVEALSEQLALLRRDAQGFREIVEVLRDPDKMKKFKQLFSETPQS